MRGPINFVLDVPTGGRDSITISIMVPISAAIKIPVAMPEYNHPIMVSAPAEMISVAIPIVITTTTT